MISMDGNTIIFMGAILVIIFLAMYAGYQMGKRVVGSAPDKSIISRILPTLKKENPPLQEMDQFDRLRIDNETAETIIPTIQEKP